ncbi:MAG: hypothetical protein M1818_008476 [Claussenomyces sp. TS43310]|nr:MAG: hypothetical protein M1818_008476 [Claussenomyces sp. TS43310]
MRHTEALVFLGTVVASVLATAESSRPRGVGPEFAKYYKNPATFTCISTPSVIIDIGQVNDDYCDCPDGSDEPGTSACTHLSVLSPIQPVSDSITGTSNVTVALPGFYCKNKGHKPEYIPFAYVNDGVCDYEVCCDGSDEWEGVGGVKCEDRCAKMGKEYKKKEAEREKAAHAARQRRAEWIKDAAALKIGVQSKISQLEDEIKALENKAADAKAKYEDVERRERGRVVMGSSGKASKVTVLAGLTKHRIEELREALLGTVQKRDAAKEKVKELEAILTTFKEEYNPNFNDEGVKRAVKSWEDYAARQDSATEGSAAEDRDIEEISKPDGENGGIRWSEWSEEEESDVDALYRFEEYLPTGVRTWLHEKIRDFRIMLVENGILADNANSGTESKLVSDARAVMDLVNDDLSKKQKQKDEHVSDLEKDYGPDDVFRSIKGNCISQDSGEYTYELCWMDKTTQRSKKGGSSTGMGQFVRFDTMVVDEEVSADGKGLGSGERLVLRYENGQHCWNGPNRRTTVIVACAEKDEIWKVFEEEKCVYRMEMGSPAVCEPAKSEAAPWKDEL